MKFVYVGTAEVQRFNESVECRPQPVIERVDQHVASMYTHPDFTVVNKCNCGHVCTNKSHRCVAVKSRTVTRCFEVQQ